MEVEGKGANNPEEVKGGALNSLGLVAPGGMGEGSFQR